MEERTTGSGSSETARQALAAAGQVIDRLGLIDLAVPALRRQLERIDIDELVEDAIDYVKRKPEVLVVLFGTLTITSGLLVFLAKHGEEMVDATRATARRAAEAMTADDDDDDEDERSSPARSPKRGSKSGSERDAGSARAKSASKR